MVQSIILALTPRQLVCLLPTPWRSFQCALFSFDFFFCARRNPFFPFLPQLLSPAGRKHQSGARSGAEGSHNPARAAQWQTQPGSSAQSGEEYPSWHILGWGGMGWGLLTALQLAECCRNACQWEYLLAPAAQSTEQLLITHEGERSTAIPY